MHFLRVFPLESAFFLPFGFAVASAGAESDASFFGVGFAIAAPYLLSGIIREIQSV